MSFYNYLSFFSTEVRNSKNPKQVGWSSPVYNSNNNMKNYSSEKRFYVSSLLVALLMTIGTGQTTLVGGVDYTIDFDIEAFDTGSGDYNCNGEASTFASNGVAWEINNAEGATCGLDCGSYTGGENDAEFETIEFNIACVADVEIEVSWSFTGGLNDEDACSTGLADGCGNDDLKFYYVLDGGAPELFVDVETCGDNLGSDTSDPLNGSTLKVVVQGGTQAMDETILVEGIILSSVVGSSAPNDDCGVADEGLMAGTNGPYNNDCATADGSFATCAAPQDEANIWFTYTTPAGVSQVEFALNAIGIMDPAWEILDGCGGTSIAESCTGSSLTVDDCNSETTFIIQVSSELALGGEFEIMVTELMGPSTDLTSCTAGADITIDEMGSNNNINDCSVCVDDLFDLTALDPNDPEDASWTYDWTDAAGGTYSGATISIAAATVADHSGTWTLSVSDGSSCPAVETMFDVSVSPLPEAIPSSDPFTCLGLDLMFFETGADIDSWLWSGDMGATFDDNTANNPISSDVTDGEEITVVVTDINGCTASSSITMALAGGVANDNCDDPIAATPTMLCAPENFEGDTAGACPEPLGGPASCMQNDDPTIWFEFTAGAAVGTVSFSDVVGSFQVYELACPPTTSVSGCITGPIDVTVTAGQQYLISGTDAAGGMVSFELTMNASPANDMCGDAEVSAVGVNSGTTSCATPDGNFCGASSDHVVYHSFTTGADISSVTVDVSGVDATNVLLEIWTDCAGTDFDPAQGDCGLSITVDCVPPNTELIIPVGSSDGGEGTYELTINETPGSVANDDCSDPIAATPSTVCAPESFDGDTAGACPEAAGTAGCGQETDPTIWFEFTADATATSVSFSNVSGSFQIFDFACPATTPVGGCITGDDDVVVTAGQQYLISGTDAAGGMISFDLTMNASPANDMCGDAADASSGSFSGTTGCATPDANICGASGDHVVYHSYTTGADVSSVTIEVAGVDATDVALEIWTDCGGTDFDAAQADCGLSITIDCVPPGTALIIPVGSSDGGEGTYDLTITETPGSGPANDDCSGADVIAIDTPCEPVPASSTTVDACPESFMAGCTQDTDATVWFTFTTLANTTSADFTNVMGSFQIFTDCPPTTSVSGCITGDENVILDPGTQYWVSATVESGEGDVSFDISLLEAPDNDNCGNAEVAGAAVSGTTGCASSDDNFCGASGEHVVYYSYTVVGPGSATVQIDVTAGDAGDIAIEGWIDCGGTDYDDTQADCVPTMLTLDCVPEGTVLIIPVGSADGMAGTFDMTITEAASGIANDDCTGAETIVIDTPCEPVPVAGTTAGACPENFTAGCSQDEDPTVWWTFTTLPGTTSAEFTNVVGEFQIMTDCPATASLGDCVTGDIGITVDPSTTYWITGTLPGSEGDVSFDLALLEAPDNDNCDNAIGASDTAITGNNGCASADGNLCGGTDHVVYYTYTVVGPGSVTLNITVNAITASDISFAAFVGCGGALMDELCGGGTDLVIDCVPEGTEVIIAIGTAEGNTGDFDVAVTEVTGGGGGPPNDNCDAAEAQIAAECEPITISGTTTDACPEFMTDCGIDQDPTVWFEVTLPAGTTEVLFENLDGGVNLALFPSCTDAGLGCVTGDDTQAGLPETFYIAAVIPGGQGDFSFDLTALIPPANDLCQDATDGSGGGTTCCSTDDGIGCPDTNTVWHQFTPSDPNAAIIITVSNVSIVGTMGVGIFTGPDCSSLTPEDPCLGGDTVERTVSCLDGETVWVQISSDADGCGEYAITFDEQPSNCTLGNECGSDIGIAPATGGGPACADACNIGVCNMDCGDATIWFEVTVDADATGMLLDVDSDFIPQVIVLAENCDGDVALGCQSTTSTSVSVVANTTYYIGVGIGDGDPGDFTLCVETVLEYALCSTGELDITRPEYPGEDPNGPYCPGEKVEFCYAVSFVVDLPNEGNNCQWLQGIVPTIGTGWDLPACPIDGQGPGGANWFDDGDVEYNINISNYGIETNCNGEQILTPGGASLGQGTPLPGGWYFTTGGTGAACTNDGNPNTMWGLSAACGSVSNVEFCFELQANNPADITECTDPCFSDMEVSMYIFADGQTGCWTQNSCAADDPTVFLDGSLDCGTLIFVEGPIEDEICSGEQLDLEYNAADGVSDILVEICEIDPNITGASDGVTFTGGSANLTDVLVNEGTDPAIVIYCLSAVSDGGTICNGPKLEVEVTVFPEIVITFEEPYDICFDGQIQISPMIEGGSGTYTEFEWSNGETTQDATAPLVVGEFPGTYEYSLTVTDDLGCTGEQVVEYVIHEEVIHAIEWTSDFACIDGTDDLIEFCATVTAGSDNEPFDYNWTYDSDLIVDEDDNCFIIDEENSEPGFYEIFLEVTDQYGCVYTQDPVFFSVENGPEVSYSNPVCLSSGGGDVEYTFEVCDDNGGVAEWSLYDESLTVLLEGPFSGSCTEFFVTPFSVGDDVPVTYFIEAIDVQTGCVAYEEFIIEPPTLPEIPFEVDGCVGEMVTITMDNFNDFEFITWCDGVSDDASYTFMLEQDETCFVTVFDFNGCELTYEILIEVSDGAEVEISGAIEFCQGTSTTLCATSNPDFDYLWSTGETTECIMVTTAGNFSVEASAGDCTATDNVDVAVGNNLVPIVNGEDVCTGSTVLLSTDNSFTTYAWTDPLGNVIPPTATGPWEVEVSAGGTYTVVVSDDSCDGAGEITIVEQAPPTADIATASPCNSMDSGAMTELDLSTLVTNATGAITIANPAGAPLVPAVVNFDGFAEGPLTYTVTVEGLDPCDDVVYDLIINVMNCGCPDLTFNDGPDVCNGSESTFNLFPFLGQFVDTDGSFSVTDAAGNPAPTQPDAAGMLIVDESYAAGIYTITYTLNTATPGCDDSNSIDFEVFQVPLPVFVMPDPVCNSDDSGDDTTIDLSSLVSGAVGQWEDSDGNVLASTMLDYNDADVGTETFFFVTTEAMGECDDLTNPVIINIVDCNCPIIGLNPLPTLCQTSDEVVLAGFLFADSEPGQWSVTGPDANAEIETPPAFNPEGLAAGIYTITYTLTTPSGSVSCDDFVEQTIEVIEAVELPLVTDIPACNSDLPGADPTFVDLTSIPELAGISGTWTAPGNYNGGVIDDETNVDFLTVTPGPYFFTFTSDDAVDPCENAIIDVLISVADCNCPTITLNDESTCNDNGEVNLDLLTGLSPDGTFTYESGPVGNVTLSGAIFDVTDAVTGDYEFLYTLDNPVVGCPETGSLIVTVFEPVFVDVGPDQTVCSVTSIQGNTFFDFEAVQGAQEGTWEVPDNYPGASNDLSNVEFDGLPVGESYTFIFNGDNQGDCDGTFDELTITVIDCDCPNITIEGNPELCNDGDVYDLTELENPMIVDGSLSVENGAGDVIATPGDMFDATGLDEGEYTVIFTPDTAPPADCDQEDTATITVVAPPSAGIFTDPATLCEEDTDVIGLADLLDGESPGGTWQETSSSNSTGTSFDDTDGTFNTDGQAPGTYTFEYMFDTSNSPCDPVSETVVVEIEATPNADAGAGGTIDCDNNMVILGGSGTSVGGDFIYHWLNPAGDTIYSGPDFELTSMEGGDWTLVVENTVTGCSAVSVASIVLDSDVPNFEFSSEDSPCFGDNGGSISVNNIIGGNPPFLFQLDDGGFETTQVWENLGPGSYQITMLDDLGCSAVRSTIIVEPGPLTFAVGDNLIVEIGESVTLDFAIPDSSIIETVIWTQDGEVICEGTASDQTLNECIDLVVEPPLVPTQYCLEIMTANGCVQIECRTLQSLAVRDVYFPTIISGWNNEAEANTNFYVHTDEFVESIPSFAIYDRWGELIHSYENGFPNSPEWGWDGRFKDQAASQGVYVYIIELQYAGGDTEIFTGTVTVTR